MLGKTWNTSSDSACSGTSSIKVSMYGSMEDRTRGTNVPEIHNKVVKEAIVMAISVRGCQTFTWRNISFSSFVFSILCSRSQVLSSTYLVSEITGSVATTCYTFHWHVPGVCTYVSSLCLHGLDQTDISHWPSIPVCPSAPIQHSTLSRNIWLQYPVSVFHLISY